LNFVTSPYTAFGAIKMLLAAALIVAVVGGVLAARKQAA
jgi:hypothetical protein